MKEGRGHALPHNRQEQEEGDGRQKSDLKEEKKPQRAEKNIQKNEYVKEKERRKGEARHSPSVWRKGKGKEMNVL